MSAIVLSHSTRRMNSVCPPKFSAAIFCLNFLQEFFAANFRSNFPQQFSAWIFRLNFRHPPQFSWDAEISCICQYFKRMLISYDFAWFSCCKYLCIISVSIYALCMRCTYLWCVLNMWTQIWALACPSQHVTWESQVYMRKTQELSPTREQWSGTGILRYRLNAVRRLFES